MKMLMAFLSILILAPTVGYACGAKQQDSGRTEKDVEQDLLKKIGGKKISCEGNGTTVSTKIDIFATYRCIGSPVYGNFKLDASPGGSIMVTKIIEDENGVLTVYIGDFAEPEICTVN